MKCKIQIVPLHIILGDLNVINKTFGNVSHTKNVLLTLHIRKLI
jgi:hypothetical protein